MRKLSLGVLWIMGFFLIYAVDQWSVSYHTKEKIKEFESMALLYQSRLESAIARRLDATEALASLLKIAPKITYEKFSEFAAHLIKTNPTIRTLQFANSQTLIIYTYPVKNNEIVVEKPLVLISDPKRGPFVKKAIQQQFASIQGPFQLRQGGTGFISRSPLFIENKFTGLAIGVYDIPKLIQDAFSGFNFQQYSFLLQDSSGKTFHENNSRFKFDKSLFVKVGDTQWTMVIGYHGSSNTQPLVNRTLIWIAGLFSLSALTGMLYLSNRQNMILAKAVKEKTKTLKTSNQTLKNEIAERKKAKLRLQSSHERFTSLFNETPVPIWEEDFTEVFKHFYDLEKNGVKNLRRYFDEHPEELFTCSKKINILDVNKAAVRLHDAKDKEQLLGHLDKIFTENSLTAFKEELIALSKGDLEFETEGEVKTISGELRYVLLRLVFTVKSPERAIALLTTIDITKRKIYENQLENLNKAIDNSLNGFDIVDENGKFIYVNKAYVTMWGYDSKEEILGTSPASHCADPTLPEKVIQTLKQKGEYEFEFQAKRKDGSLFDVLMYARLAHDQEGREIYPTTSIDVTEKKLLQNKLHQAQKMESVGNLAGGIAHEFNNILSIIIGNNELIMTELPKWSPSAEFSREIKTASLRARDVVKQLLTFSRQDDARRKPIDIAKAVKESIKLVRSSIPANIEIEQNITPDCSRIIGNITQINQIIINLCSNAADAMPDNRGKIKIDLKNSTAHGTELQDSAVTLIVSDNGTGIEQKSIKKIFEPYYTTKEIGKGTGIGLAVVHGIVDKHQGTISVESRPDMGTSFKICFPAYSGPVEEFTDKGQHKPKGSESIIVVDDEPSIAKLTARHLENLGYSSAFYTNPLKALEALQHFNLECDLIITDMAMPEMTGDLFTQKVLELRPGLPVIISTGYNDKMSAKKAEAIGARSFIMKPVDHAKLSVIIRNALDENSPKPV